MDNKQLIFIRLLVLNIVFVLSGCSESLRTNNLFVPNEPLITITTNNANSREFKVGEKIIFTIKVSHPLYVHCFYVSGNEIIKLAPQHTYRHHGNIKPIRPDWPIVIDGGVTASPVGVDEVTCVGAEKPLLYKIPRKISDLNVFDKVDYSSINKVFSEFEKVTDSQLYYNSISIKLVNI